MTRIRWLIYTVLIGLVPIIIRYFLFLIFKGTTKDYILNEIDIVTFGLVLHVSNINELDNYTGTDKDWKSISIGCSIFSLILFAVLLGFSYISDLGKIQDLDKSTLKNLALFLGAASFLFSFSIFTKLSRP